MSDSEKVLVKICGITRFEDGMCALSAGVDFIGLVFYHKSPRYILPQAAEAMMARFRDEGFPDVRAIGVFVNETPERINRIVQNLDLFAVQLHADEPPEYAAKIQSCVIKAVRIRDESDLDVIGKWPAWAYLCDAWHPEHYGGTGKRIDASMISPYVSRNRVILAGGLNPENVSEALAVADFFAVDVSSGVEESPGKKDHEKVRKFIRAVKKFKK